VDQGLTDDGRVRAVRASDGLGYVRRRSTRLDATSEGTITELPPGTVRLEVRTTLLPHGAMQRLTPVLGPVMHLREQRNLRSIKSALEGTSRVHTKPNPVPTGAAVPSALTWGDAGTLLRTSRRRRIATRTPPGATSRPSAQSRVVVEEPRSKIVNVPDSNATEPIVMPRTHAQRRLLIRPRPATNSDPEIARSTRSGRGPWVPSSTIRIMFSNEGHESERK
jgi:hypothetical protein